jgi:transcriptional regulator with XRE-family HTH domain
MRTPGQKYDCAALFATMRLQGRKQQWLASETGFTRSYLSKLVSGERAPNPIFRARASKALGLPESVLFLPINSDDSDKISDEQAAD